MNFNDDILFVWKIIIVMILMFLFCVCMLLEVGCRCIVVFCSTLICVHCHSFLFVNVFISSLLVLIFPLQIVDQMECGIDVFFNVLVLLGPWSFTIFFFK